MKPILSFLLIIFLSACSYHPATHIPGEIGNTVKESSNSLSITPNPKCPGSASCPEESQAISIFSTSVLERSAIILTW